MRICELITKNCKLEFNKSLSGDYDISGTITVYDTPDLVGDVIERGALTNFISKYNQTGIQGRYNTPLPMYFQHNIEDPVGYWAKFEEKGNSVIGYGKFYDTTRAKDIRIIAKDKNSIIGGLSVGFTSSDYEDNNDENGKRIGDRFKEITLKETSIVTSPAMPAAKITRVKDTLRKADGTLNLVTVERCLREAGANRDEAKQIVHAVKDYLVIHIEIDPSGDEARRGLMPSQQDQSRATRADKDDEGFSESESMDSKDDGDGETVEAESMDAKDMKKLAQVLSEIKAEMELKQFVNSLGK